VEKIEIQQYEERARRMLNKEAKITKNLQQTRKIEAKR
jgi:hypothetical protein